MIGHRQLICPTSGSLPNYTTTAHTTQQQQQKTQPKKWQKKFNRHFSKERKIEANSADERRCDECDYDIF